MEQRQLIEALSAPSAYPLAVEAVEVRQTHISVVFLAGPLAYKIKKPVDLGFVDYGTLERRRHFCEEEVRLNRRLAPDDLSRGRPRDPGGRDDPDGGHGRGRRMGGEDEAAPRGRDAPCPSGPRRCRSRGAGGTGSPARPVPCRGRVRRRSPPAARFEAIARNARENFEQSAPQVGVTLSQSTLDRLEVADRGGPGPSPWHHRGPGPPRHPPRHPRRPPPRSRLLVPGARSSGRLGRGRLHRVRRAVPPRRSRSPTSLSSPWS